MIMKKILKLQLLAALMLVTASGCKKATRN